VEEIFHKNIDKLYNCYIELASESNFPLITWLIWAGFASSMNKDGKVQQGTIDRIYKAVLSDGKGEGMTRYHFFEGVVRFAVAKYVDTEIVTSTSEAI
jgi:hypothetical protein